MARNTENFTKLHIGCGTNYKDGFINVDIDPDVKADWHGNCNNMPFDNSSFDEIYSNHALEHFDCLFTILEEMARVSKNGATWNITVPYYSWPQHLANPHHKIKYWNEFTFKFFDKENGVYKRGQQQPYSIEIIEQKWNDQQITYNLKLKK